MEFVVVCGVRLFKRKDFGISNFLEFSCWVPWPLVEITALQSCLSGYDLLERSVNWIWSENKLALR